MRLAHLTGLVLLLTGNAVLAASQDEAATDPKKIVCRDDARTGSRVKRSICLPQEEWDKFDKKSAEAAQGVINGAIGGQAITEAARSGMTMDRGLPGVSQ
jgi:hypothetical protein